LQTAANNFVPKCRKGFVKFWWDEELKVLKDAATESNKIWTCDGKPRQGPVFLKLNWLNDSLLGRYIESV